jgi:hypothetical protein
MPKKKYLVDRSDEERQSLLSLLRSGKHPSRKLTRARILLQADDGYTFRECQSSEGKSVANISGR